MKEALLQPRLVTSQRLIVLLIFTALLLDGVDIQLLSYVAPIIIEEWQLDKARFAPALAAALVGMSIGTGVGGWLGDRVGPKIVLGGSVVLFGVATAATCFSNDAAMLTALRSIGGLGFGAAYPNGLALVSEALPKAARARAMGLMSISTPLGGMLGAGASLVLLTSLGWRNTFVLCGSLAVLVGVVICVWLPESPAYLAKKGRKAEAEGASRRIFGSAERALSPGGSPSTAAEQRRSIFVPELTRLNLGAGGTFFAIGFVTYAVASWTPTVLTSAGLVVQDAILASFFYSTFAIAGSLLVGWALPRVGSKALLRLTCVLSLTAVVSLSLLLAGRYDGASAAARIALFLTTGLAGGALGGAIAAIYAVLAAGYPVERRATGIGFGLTLGRLGGIVAVLSGGVLLELSRDASSLFYGTLALVMAVGIAISFVIDRHVPGASQLRKYDSLDPEPKNASS